MGTNISQLPSSIRQFSGLRPKDMKTNIYVAGTDKLGKMTVLRYFNKLKEGGIVSITSMPDTNQIQHDINTVGAGLDSFATIDYTNISFHSMDDIYMTCHDELDYFNLNRKPIKYQNGIIFIVNPDDRYNIINACSELHGYLQSPRLKEAALLILVNNQSTTSMSTMDLSEISDRLQLHDSRDRCWRIHNVSTASGEGLLEALEWLISSIWAFENSWVVIKAHEEKNKPPEPPEPSNNSANESKSKEIEKDV